jgi:hypothetical protein
VIKQRNFTRHLLEFQLRYFLALLNMYSSLRLLNTCGISNQGSYVSHEFNLLLYRPQSSTFNDNNEQPEIGVFDVGLPHRMSCLI